MGGHGQRYTEINAKKVAQLTRKHYRIFFCYDEGQIVILFNGFQKKTQKTPNKEINKALKLKEEYYERKRRNKDV